MLENGEVFADDYRVVRRLGEGGFGAVYEALQLSTGRRRALKVMHHDLRLDGELRERFVREARIGAEIESEHVVEVVGAGVTRDGVPWLAMELLEGWTLTEAVGHGPLAPSMLLDVLAQLCHGLDAAHRAGVVHRDLKPDNVFLARPRGASPDAALRVKLLDFGIARCAEGSQTGRNSQVLGSPRWMAPEQLVVGARLGPEADVWAFALLVFFCWTGRSYWLAGQVGASNVAALLLEIHGGPVEAPSSRAATLGAAAAWPRALDRWFLRCVARDPAARFASIDDAFDDLRRALGPLGDASADGGAAPTEELAIPSTAAPPADPGVATVPPGARVARPRSLESTLLPTRAGPRPPTPAAAAATAAATRAASAPSRRRATIVLATIGAVL
ncbi:MAG: serine/threonine protein kinase, partial [Deltaproteobacteria bacterium]|nr:serine/threonine protein kinase [Deltaproteobacteria bacterium]